MGNSGFKPRYPNYPKYPNCSPPQIFSPSPAHYEPTKPSTLAAHPPAPGTPLPQHTPSPPAANASPPHSSTPRDHAAPKQPPATAAPAGHRGTAPSSATPPATAAPTRHQPATSLRLALTLSLSNPLHLSVGAGGRARVCAAARRIRLLHARRPSFRSWLPESRWWRRRVGLRAFSGDGGGRVRVRRLHHALGE